MFNAHIELELDGPDNGWTRVTQDVLRSDNISLRYGVSGHGPEDRVADSGVLSFTMDNSEYNSAGLIGYYSPGHTNLRAGFKMGCGVRLVIEYAELTYYKFRGVIDEITPEPGLYGTRRTFVNCTDFMDQAGREIIGESLPVQLNQRSDQIFSTIVAAMRKQPPALQVGYGMEQYTYALDGTRDESMTVMTEFQKLANSEMGFIYQKGDGIQGGTLVFEDRRARGVTTESVAAFENLNVLKPTRKRDDVINQVKVTVHPRRADALVPTFTPDDVAGLTLWLDAEDLDASLNDGDLVAQWSDKSGQANHFTQSQNGNKPTFRTGIKNGHPALEFDGGTDFITCVNDFINVFTSSELNLFVVFRPDSAATKTVIGDESGGTARASIRCLTGPQLRFGHSDSGGVDAVNFSFVLSEWIIATLLHTGGNVYGGKTDTRDASLASTASGSTVATTQNIRIGSQTLSEQFQGYICEVIGYNQALTEANRQDIESYLAVKYGITIPYDATGTGEADTTIFMLQEKPFIPRGTSFTFTALYKDPDQTQARIGAMGQVDPEAETDYTFSPNVDGSGTDLTGQITVSCVFGGNSAEVTVANAGPSDGYLDFFQLRGLGVYDDAEVVSVARDTDLQDEYGVNSLAYDMPYQSDVGVALDAANYLLQQNKSEDSVPGECGFIANRSDALMRQSILREISDRIDIMDPVTALDNSFFINEIAIEINGEGVLTVTWGLTPASTELYWILDSDTQSQLDETTRLAFGLFNRYWLLGSGVMGSDTRLS